MWTVDHKTDDNYYLVLKDNVVVVKISKAKNTLDEVLKMVK